MKFSLKLFAIISLFLFTACNDKDKDYDKTKAVSAFAISDQIAPDASLEKITISLPKQINLEEWTSSSSVSNQVAENLAFAPQEKSLKKGKFLSGFSRIWTGYRPAFSDRFVFEPIIKDNVIFMLDASGIIAAYDLTSKNKIWEKRVFAKKYLKSYQNPKIGYFDNQIFAITGTNEIVAICAESGEILWSKSISSIPISTPVSDGKSLYVTTTDNKTYALDASDGKLLWVSSGINKTTAIFGAADPVIHKNSLIVSYSSGEIYALNKNSGDPLWSKDLNLNKAINSDFYLNDIDATALIKNDIIYSIGNGGLMMAIDTKNGNYLWKKEIAGISDFWIANDFLYVISSDDKLIAVYKKTGAIKWVMQLPNFKNKKDLETKIIYNGLVMAGDKLLISDSRGSLLIASPLDGHIEQTFKIDQKISHPPVVVNKKIYLHGAGRYTINLLEIY